MAKAKKARTNGHYRNAGAAQNGSRRIFDDVLALAGTLAWNTFAPMMRPWSETILAANSISAIGSGEVEIWNFRISSARCLSATSPSTGLETAFDRPAFSNVWTIFAWRSLGVLSLHSAVANVGSSLGFGRIRNLRVSSAKFLRRQV